MTEQTHVPGWLADADRDFTGKLRAELAIDDLLARVKARAMVREIGGDASSGRLDPADRDEAITRALGGEREAVARLLVAVRPLVVRYCRARIGTRANADDVAQEACLAVLRALPGYVLGDKAFLAFVHAIARTKVDDALAYTKTTRAMTPLPSSLDSRMLRLLRILPDRQREILVLRIVVGLSAEETAGALGISPGKVRGHQHRALTRLRREIGTEGD